MRSYTFRYARNYGIIGRLTCTRNRVKAFFALSYLGTFSWPMLLRAAKVREKNRQAEMEGYNI